MSGSNRQKHEAVVLVGHGGVPKDFPRAQLGRLKALETERESKGGEMSEEERELDNKIRRWPRDMQNDPYQAGLELIGAALRQQMSNHEVTLAYNEFCAPTIEQAVAELREKGIRSITLLSSMLTQGGIHSEIEIPEIVSKLRGQYPDISLRYVWPPDVNMVAKLMADLVNTH